MQPQLNISFANKDRDKGIKRAIDHANEVNDRWSEKVYGLLKDYLKANGAPFQSEDFRHSIMGLIVDPPHNRAFGGIMKRAAAEGLIKRVGTAPVKNVNAHIAFATVWQRNQRT